MTSTDLKTLPFIGKFKDLIPLGFEFCKLFAGNHRCYVRKIGKSNNIWIWQKGCEVEYGDFHDLTIDAFRALLDDDKFQWKQHRLSIDSLPWDAKSVTIDRDERKVIAFDRYAHDTMFIPFKYYEGKNLPRVSELPKNILDEMDEVSRRYRKVVFGKSDLDAVKFLLDNKLIEL